MGRNFAFFRGRQPQSSTRCPPSSAVDSCRWPDPKPARSHDKEELGTAAFWSHSFTKRVTGRDLDSWIRAKKTRLLVSDQGFTPTLFSAKKELKNHIIYTYTTVCIENVCTRGRDGLPARWELLAHEMLGVRGGGGRAPSRQLGDSKRNGAGEGLR